MANWLDTFFYPFDHAILEAVHRFTVWSNGIFTLPLELITMLANSGLGMILLGLILCTFLKSRRQGFTVLFAIACGALITNVALKNIVVRARPYETVPLFAQWRDYILGIDFFDFHVSDHSFPSGHTTATTAAMTAIFLTTEKKKSWPVFIFVALMGFSRLYLMVHYPTDVLAGLIAGLIGAVGGYYLVKLGYRLIIDRHPDWRIVRFYNSFDLIALFGKLFGKKEKKDLPADGNSTEIPDNGIEKAENEEAEEAK